MERVEEEEKGGQNQLQKRIKRIDREKVSGSVLTNIYSPSSNSRHEIFPSPLLVKFGGNVLTNTGRSRLEPFPSLHLFRLELLTKSHALRSRFTTLCRQNLRQKLIETSDTLLYCTCLKP